MEAGTWEEGRAVDKKLFSFTVKKWAGVWLLLSLKDPGRGGGGRTLPSISLFPWEQRYTGQYWPPMLSWQDATSSPWHQGVQPGRACTPHGRLSEWCVHSHPPVTTGASIPLPITFSGALEYRYTSTSNKSNIWKFRTTKQIHFKRIIQLH